MLDKLMRKESLSYEESIVLADDVLNKRITDDKIEAALIKLNLKGETYHEIAGFATAMKRNAKSFKATELNIMDTCGTGGDGLETFNISTAVAFVLAAAGINVAKHGNRSVSSKCGSADILEAMGFDLQLTERENEQLFSEEGFCFLFAQAYHTKMKTIMPIRKKIGKPSIFNIIGPLSNPANVTHQMIGVYTSKLLRPVYEAMKTLGLKSGAVVHGYGGMDELSLEGENEVLCFNGVKEQHLILNPKHYGFEKIENKQLKGGSKAVNLEIMQHLLAGDESPYKEAVIFNAGFCIYLNERVESIKEGMKMARMLIDEGQVEAKVNAILNTQAWIKSSTILDEIFEYKNQIYASDRQDLLPLSMNPKQEASVKKRAKLSPLLKSSRALYLKAQEPSFYPIIGEIKRGSPSKGKFTEALDIESVIKHYEALNVIGISVLADQKYFYANEEDVYNVSRLTDKPILYKEFIVSEKQIQMAKQKGASLILLIARMLPVEQLEYLTQYAHEHDLEVLMEIHQADEFEKVSGIDFDILGINNRDLQTFKTDIDVSVNLYNTLGLASYSKPIVSESGITSLDEMDYLIKIGFHGVLMGEHLIRSVTQTGIKICGVKSVEEAHFVAQSGAHYIGLVFAESKRQVAIQSAYEIVNAIKETGIKTVAVFKDQTVAEINKVIETIPFDMIQIHGPFDDYEALNRPVQIIKAFSYKEILEAITAYHMLSSHPKVDYYLMDAMVPGSGKTFDWEILKQIKSSKPLIIAGGLTSDNVAELIRGYHPFAVDVSSGVEQEGKKNKALMHSFVKQCYSADECKLINRRRKL
ncbi:anthranilate phosphoribosyltransferase [Fusibacter sp. 3D3]|uniref:anthranilate phosphoribosyltransferase n=1 Tax=Fusibacter sp. 3D3 TaxID=1048380 RepID=UPI0008535F85|nr:anthranilate phosphoribosyltransferase [Fusibacter sp. 3D3]GAU77228.1 anthranilate phosphoribosyltransferase [Fusibacter sp. 3D3]